MDRESPRTISNEIDLYIRTYYSLLRTSADVRVRAFEETHLFSNSSLHSGARKAAVDVGAFAYAAARLPDCMPQVKRLILGQNQHQFERVGLDVSQWKRVRSRGRRRLILWRDDTLAVFITSASDIDDLVPIVTAYQIEWNKLGALLAGTESMSIDKLAAALSMDGDEFARLTAALGRNWQTHLATMRAKESDLTLRLLDGSLREYRRTARGWWSDIDKYIGDGDPVYFVSSNSHSLPNLLGGYTRDHQDRIETFIGEDDPEGLARELEAAHERGDEGTVNNIHYYALRTFLQRDRSRMAEVEAHDLEHGIRSVRSAGGVDVDAQVIKLNQLPLDKIDPRCHVPGLASIAESNATIVNIDYPLGMAAYHHLAEISLTANLRGIYVMGKAATLNGRVGDVMISEVVYDEHSKNTYVFENQFSALDIAPNLQRGTVLDHQKAVTVRSAFLQNHDYMGVFYQEGYTVLEMEAGPYLSALYEMVAPKRHPTDQIVRLSSMLDLEVGIIHYASDTPYSRRQHLLSKSMSYFGVDATYASAIAIARRIFAREVASGG